MFCLAPLQPWMWNFLIGASLVCASLSVPLSRWKRLQWTPPTILERTLECLLLLLLLVHGYFQALHVHSLLDPTFCPVGQDHQEYLAHVLHLRDSRLGALSPYRYPLWPLLASLLSSSLKSPPYFGTMLVTFFSSALLPAGTYLVLREWVPRALALVGPLLVLSLPPSMMSIASPSEYVFCAMVQTVALASGLAMVRKPGLLRALLFGTTLAALMASTPKALTFLLVGLPIGTIAALLRPGRALHRVSSAVVLWLPLIGTWVAFSVSILELYSLEHAVYKVQKDAAGGHRLEARLKPGLGWAPGSPEQEGFWRVGSSQALRHLPETLAFLVSEPDGFIPRSFRIEWAQKNLSDDLRLESSLTLLLAVLSCALACLFPPRGHWRVQWLLASALVLATTIGQGVALTRSIYMTRYALPLLALLPSLVVVGAALPILALWRLPEGRLPSLALWALPVLTVLMLARPLEPASLREDLKTRPEWVDRSQTSALCALRTTLSGDDGIALLTSSSVPAALFYQRVHFGGGEQPENGRGVLLKKVAWRRRIVVTSCFDRLEQPWEQERWSAIVDQARREPERLRIRGACVLEDLRPGEELVLEQQLAESGIAIP